MTADVPQTVINADITIIGAYFVTFNLMYKANDRGLLLTRPALPVLLAHGFTYIP